jgi:hypothetical protein
MLSHCANSICGTPFLRLQQGKLFLVETEDVSKPSTDESFVLPPKRKPPRSTQRYWLCDQCARIWTLAQDKDRRIVLLLLLVPAAPPVLMRAEIKGTA